MLKTMVISTPEPRLTRHDLVKVTAEYTNTQRQQYRIRAITFPQDSTVLSSAVRETEDRTLLKKIRATI
jgi:hypothetical protein